jgi:hypothetical protein
METHRENVAKQLKIYDDLQNTDSFIISEDLKRILNNPTILSFYVDLELIMHNPSMRKRFVLLLQEIAVAIHYHHGGNNELYRFLSSAPVTSISYHLCIHFLASLPFTGEKRYWDVLISKCKEHQLVEEPKDDEDDSDFASQFKSSQKIEELEKIVMSLKAQLKAGRLTSDSFAWLLLSLLMHRK